MMMRATRSGSSSFWCRQGNWYFSSEAALGKCVRTRNVGGQPRLSCVLCESESE